MNKPEESIKVVNGPYALICLIVSSILIIVANFDLLERRSKWVLREMRGLVVKPKPVVTPRGGFIAYTVPASPDYWQIIREMFAWVAVCVLIAAIWLLFGRRSKVNMASGFEVVNRRNQGE